MHIPDSVLSPTTCAVSGLAMAPVWWIAARRVKERLGTRQVPLLALGASFCFTVMMFNIPALGGTTAHPVAGTMLAVLLGPWAACLGISVTLLIQALLFGDGGLLAYGANCFTMAFALPFAGYAVYRLVMSLGRNRAKYAPVAAAIGAYVGINCAAALVAILLGIQPVLFHEPDGHALYFPFGMRVTLSAMLGTHLLVAGPAEAIVTGLVVRYLQASGIALFDRTGSTSAAESGQDAGSMRGERRERVWMALFAMLALTPLGLLARGEAWGEWDAKGIAQQTERQFGAGRGYTPRGIAAGEERAYGGVAGLKDYASDDGRNRLGYLFAGLVGAGAIGGALAVGGRLLVTSRAGSPARQATPAPQPVARDGSLPAWLTSSSSVSGAAEGRMRPANRFVERTLGEFAAAAAAGLRLERAPGQRGLLQSLDPRARLLSLLILILVTGLTRNLAVLVGLYLAALAVGVLSGISVRVLAARAWLSAPLLVAAIALPTLFSPVTPGPAVAVLWRHPYLAITEPGLHIAGMLTLRVSVAVTFALLLTLSTRWNDLLYALRALRAPRQFVAILAMTYRYIAVTLQIAADAVTARRSRTVGRSSNRSGRGFVGISIGALFGKSLALADEIHGAMLARGYQGEMRVLRTACWRFRDGVWVAGVVAAACALRVLG